MRGHGAGHRCFVPMRSCLLPIELPIKMLGHDPFILARMSICGVIDSTHSQRRVGREPRSASQRATRGFGGGATRPFVEAR